MALFARRPTEQEAREIRAILSHRSGQDAPQPVLQKRAQAVVLSLQREKVPQIATTLQVHYTTITRWLTCYNRFGWAALVAMPSSLPSADSQTASADVAAGTDQNRIADAEKWHP